jgi:hypothetical protein
VPALPRCFDQQPNYFLSRPRDVAAHAAFVGSLTSTISLQIPQRANANMPGPGNSGNQRLRGAAPRYAASGATFVGTTRGKRGTQPIDEKGHRVSRAHFTHRQTLRPAQRCTVTARPQDFAPLIPRGSAHACTPSSCSRPHARAAPAPCGCRSQPPVGASRTSDAYAALGIIVIMPTAGLCRCHVRGLRSSKGWMARWLL